MTRDFNDPTDPVFDVDQPFRPRGARILETLTTYFLEMPKGESFPERATFEAGFAAFQEATDSGTDLSAEALLNAIDRHPTALVVLRSIVGLTPPELVALAAEEAEREGTTLTVSQEDARAIDAAARRGERTLDPAASTAAARRYNQAIVDVVTHVAPVLRRRPTARPGSVHRLDKIDTARGEESLADYLGGLHVPYADLLYERVLGRPFASHKDSVSSKVGDIIDDAVEAVLRARGIPYYKTRHRERIDGFDQAPDFLIPSREGAEAIIEDKLTEDDGTARDKVARILRLREVEGRRARAGEQARTVIAVIDGRGFRERVGDLNYMLGACDGHVYTVAMLDELVADDGPLSAFIGTAA